VILNPGLGFGPSRYTPPAFAAPEILFGDVLTPASDIWSLGCLIFNRICGYSLWSYLTSLDDVLIDTTLAYGRLLERWCTKWERREDYFEKDGQLKEYHVGKISTGFRDLKTLIIKQLLKVRSDMVEEELDEFSRLMVAMMKLEPAERVTAKEALRLIFQAWVRDRIWGCFWCHILRTSCLVFVIAFKGTGSLWADFAFSITLT
jgi:serine/threonine protein kinase